MKTNNFTKIGAFSSLLIGFSVSNKKKRIKKRVRIFLTIVTYVGRSKKP